MNNVPFTLSQVRPIRDAMTVSRPSGLGYGVPVTWFSLGAGTSITPESYDCTTLYLGGEGNGKFLLGVDGQEVSVKPGEVLYVPPKTLCGTKTDGGMIYTEIILKKENFTMNNIIKAGQPTELKNLISYEEGSIARVLSTNLNYLPPATRNAPWFIEVDMSKYISYIIATLNHDHSLHSLLNPLDRIKRLLERYHKEQAEKGIRFA